VVDRGQKFSSVASMTSRLVLIGEYICPFMNTNAAVVVRNLKDWFSEVMKRLIVQNAILTKWKK
jgi:hypothetical protein